MFSKNGEVALATDAAISRSKVPSFDSRVVGELRTQLIVPATDFDELSKSPTESIPVGLSSGG